MIIILFYSYLEKNKTTELRYKYFLLNKKKMTHDHDHDSYEMKQLKDRWVNVVVKHNTTQWWNLFCIWLCLFGGWRHYEWLVNVEGWRFITNKNRFILGNWKIWFSILYEWLEKLQTRKRSPHVPISVSLYIIDLIACLIVHHLIDSREMEFPQVGQHCSVKTCNRLGLYWIFWLKFDENELSLISF